MADLKISQLPAATLPLAGTELLPIVQSGTTKQASVANLVNDRSINPSVVQQNGKSTPYVLTTNSIPFVAVSSGTMGDNGALSGITAVQNAYASAYVYLPANAISAGSSAGWYYAVFNSTTAATVYNNTYTSGSPTIPGSPTAFVTTGPGAFTQSTGYITGFTFTIPANTVGVNGSIQITSFQSNNNSANIKQININIASNTVLNTAATTTVQYWGVSTVTNRGVLTRQYAMTQQQTTYSQNYYTSTNMGNAQTVTCFLKLANAADTITHETVVVTVFA